MREEGHHIAIPVTDVREENTLLLILAELKKQTGEMQGQTKILQQIWGQIDLKLAGFTFTLKPIDNKEISMADLQIIRGGKGVKVVASPVNAEQQPIPLPDGEQLAWTSSDDTNAPIAPDPNDPTGLTGIGQAVGDAVGVVFTLTGTGTDGSVISDPAPPIDIIEDTKLGGFKFDETSL